MTAKRDATEKQADTMIDLNEISFSPKTRSRSLRVRVAVARINKAALDKSDLLLVVES